VSNERSSRISPSANRYLILGSQVFLCFPSFKTHEKVGNNTITLRLGKFLENGPGFQGYTFRRFLYFETQKTQRTDS